MGERKKWLNSTKIHEKTNYYRVAMNMNEDCYVFMHQNNIVSYTHTYSQNNTICN
jgi:hypothetical protein